MDVCLDLGCQFVNAGEFDFIPQPAHHIYTDAVSIQILVVIKDVDFNGEHFIPEGGGKTDVGNPFVLAAVLGFNGNGVDAQFGAEFVVELDVGGGKAQLAAPPFAAFDYLTTDLVITAKIFSGLLHIPKRRQNGFKIGTRDKFAINLK